MADSVTWQGAGPGDRPGLASRARVGAPYLISPMAFLLAWIVIAAYGHSRFIPTPWQAIAAAGEWIFGIDALSGGIYAGTWMRDLGSSIIRVLIGYAIAVVVGVPLGLFIGWSPTVQKITDPLIQLMRPIPITAWLPFTIALFGIHERSAWFLIALGAFFPIVVNATAGAQQTPRVLIQAALMLGCKPKALVRRVVLPSALPSVFTGLRLGIGLAWVLVIVAELLAVQSGLGYALWNAYQQFRIDIIVVAMATVGVAGFLSDRIIVYWRRIALRWAE